MYAHDLVGCIAYRTRSANNVTHSDDSFTGAQNAIRILMANTDSIIYEYVGNGPDGVYSLYKTDNHTGFFDDDWVERMDQDHQLHKHTIHDTDQQLYEEDHPCYHR